MGSRQAYISALSKAACKPDRITSGGTPVAVAERTAGELKKAVTHPQVREEIRAQEVEPSTHTPAEYRKFVDDGIARWT